MESWPDDEIVDDIHEEDMMLFVSKTYDKSDQSTTNFLNQRNVLLEAELTKLRQFNQSLSSVDDFVLKTLKTFTSQTNPSKVLKSFQNDYINSVGNIRQKLQCTNMIEESDLVFDFIKVNLMTLEEIHDLTVELLEIYKSIRIRNFDQCIQKLTSNPILYDIINYTVTFEPNKFVLNTIRNISEIADKPNKSMANVIIDYIKNYPSRQDILYSLVYLQTLPSFEDSKWLFSKYPEIMSKLITLYPDHVDMSLFKLALSTINDNDDYNSNVIVELLNSLRWRLGGGLFNHSKIVANDIPINLIQYACLKIMDHGNYEDLWNYFIALSEEIGLE